MVICVKEESKADSGDKGHMSEDMKSRPETNLGDGVNTSWWPGEGTKSSTVRQYTGGRKVETHRASHPRQPFQSS